MEISYLGHASFKIKTKSALIVTDPYDPKMVGLKFPKMAADIVTISHDHADHNKVDLIKNSPKIVNGPGEYEISGVSIIGVPSFHDNKKGADRGKNTIYVFEVEGLRLVHLGDLGHKLDEGQIESIGDINILMIPTGGEFTIGATDAVEIVHALEPNIIIPMHYKIPRLNSDIFAKLQPVDAFLKELAVSVEETDKLIVREALPEEQKVVKLAPVNG